jgi:hypothetical protein
MVHFNQRRVDSFVDQDRCPDSRNASLHILLALGLSLLSIVVVVIATLRIIHTEYTTTKNVDAPAIVVALILATKRIVLMGIQPFLMIEDVQIPRVSEESHQDVSCKSMQSFSRIQH